MNQIGVQQCRVYHKVPIWAHCCLLLMVIDLPKVVSKCQVMLYADDAVLFFSSQRSEDIEAALNFDLKQVYEWVKVNKLALNQTKTEFMLFGSQTKLSKLEKNICIELEQFKISQVYTYRYLGVWLDPTLNWKEHVTKTSKKIGSRIALLGRSKRYLPLEGRKLLANALILPLFEYCCNAWSHCSQKVVDIIVKQHKKMARVIVGANVRTPTQQIFNTLKWVDIRNRWNFSKCKMIYSVFETLSPLYILQMFTKSQSLHNHRTRSAENVGLILPKIKTQMGKQSYSYEGAALWNSLPNHIRNAPSSLSFSLLFWRHIRSNP